MANNNLEEGIKESFRAVRKDILGIYSELNSLKKKLDSEIYSKLKSLSLKVSANNEKRKKVEKEISKLKQDISVIDEFIGKLRGLEVKIEKFENEFSNLKKSINDLSKKSRKGLKALERVSNKIKTQEIGLRRDFDTKIENLSSQLNKIKQNLGVLSEIKEALAVINEIAENYASIDSVRKVNKRITSRINRLKKNVEIIYDDLADFERIFVQKNDFKIAISRIDKKIANFNNELNRFLEETVERGELDSRTRSLNAKIINLKKELSKVYFELDELKKLSKKNYLRIRENEKLSIDIGKVEVKTNKLEKKIVKLSKNLEVVRSLFDAEEHRNNIIESKIDSLSKEITALNARLDNLENISFPGLTKVLRGKKRISKPSTTTYIVIGMLFLLTFALLLAINYPQLLTHILPKSVQKNISGFIGITNITPENLSKVSNISNITNMTITNVSEGVVIKNLTKNLTANKTRNITNITKGNVSEGKAQIETNLTVQITQTKTPKKVEKVISGEELEKKNELCILKYECKRIANKYFYDCYYSVEDNKCHCFKGSFEDCDIKKLSELKEKYNKFSKLKESFDIFKRRIIYAYSKIAFFTFIYKGYIIVSLFGVFVLLLLLSFKTQIINFFTEEVEEEPTVKKSEGKARKRRSKRK